MSEKSPLDKIAEKWSFSLGEACNAAFEARAKADSNTFLEAIKAIQKETIAASNLSELVNLGIQVRQAQKNYFKTRTKEALITSKTLETEFDKKTAFGMTIKIDDKIPEGEAHLKDNKGYLLGIIKT